MKSKHNIFHRFLLVLVSLAGMLVAFEFILRAMPHTPPSSPLGDRSPFFYVPAEDRGHPWSQGATNAMRIAIIGDSFTAGVGVEADDRYADRLERLLNMKSGKSPVEVRVYALCGSSTFQQIELLDEALVWKPHVVVLGICLNDMEDWTNPKELMRWREGLFPKTTPPWLAGVLQFSRALDWLYARAQAAQAEREELRYYRRLYAPSYSGVARFREAIQIMNDKCREARAVFVPMIWPLLSENFQEGRYPFEFAHAAIRRRCEELRLPCLDLLPFFREASPERLQVAPNIDPHPNEIAHRVAAEALLLFLLDESYIARDYGLDAHVTANYQRRIWEQIMQRMHTPMNSKHAPGSG